MPDGPSEMESGEGVADDGQENVNDLASFDFDLLTEAGDGNTWCEQCKKYEQVCTHSTCTNVLINKLHDKRLKVFTFTSVDGTTTCTTFLFEFNEIYHLRIFCCTFCMLQSSH